MTPEQKRAKEFLDAMNETMKGISSSKESMWPFDLEAARMLGLNKHKEKESAKDKLINILTMFGLGGLLAVFVVVSLTIYSIFATGFVGAKLWLWFLVPLGLPKISILHTAGIAMIARLFTYEGPFGYTYNDKEHSTAEKVRRFIGLLLLPWITLLIGYLIHINMFPFDSGVYISTQ